MKSAPYLGSVGVVDASGHQHQQMIIVVYINQLFKVKNEVEEILNVWSVDVLAITRYVLRKVNSTSFLLVKL